MKAEVVIQALSNVNGASFVGFDALTPVTLTGGKKNPHQGRVQKLMTGAQVMCFQNKKVNGYEEMVRRRLLAEGKDPETFVLGERLWGNRVPNLPIVEHEKDGVKKTYMEVIFLKAGKVTYLLDGTPVDPAEIQGIKEASEGEQGGLSNKVVIRTFDTNNVIQLRVDGQVFS